MSILANKDTRVIAQGITGRLGSFATGRMIEYGTKVVAGVTPGKGGTESNGVPVYDTVREAVTEHPADATITFVPPPFVKEAIFEALEVGIKLIVVAVERMPVKDMMIVHQALRQSDTVLLGPNSPGIITADECSIGYFPGDVYRRGPVGIVSRSGTFSYQVADYITKAGLGETTALGLGGDPVTGVNFIDILKLYEADPETKVIVLIGEIGRTSEEQAAEYIQSEVSKPVVAIIAGRTAPPGKTMGHAGAIITGGRGSYDSKVKALEKAGVPVVRTAKEVATLAKQALGSS
ncbi:MAG: succinate--CoA ligase subunit alpha [Dehalococcoidia bacterium]|nr:succinate--CoA ligase subunit alpha [Dehalococcoidia bacterium]